MARWKRWLRFQLWQAGELLRWRAAGRPLPAPHGLKKIAVWRAARRHRCPVLLETGTYGGEMVAFARGWFRHVVSIEVDPALHARARKRFRGAPGVELVLGDSAQVLPRLLSAAPWRDEPVLYWLDGHHSAGNTGRGAKDTPIREELDAVFARGHPGDVILIDDARCFDGTRDYPRLEELVAAIRARRPDLRVWVERDVVHAEPSRR